MAFRLRNILLFMLIPIGISGCLWLRQPKKFTFKYYDKNYTPNIAASKLRADGFYTNSPNWPREKGRETCSYIYFKPNGEVIEIYSSCDLNTWDIRGFQKEVFGYYKLNGDTVFYTTQAFYNKNENKSIGILSYNHIRVMTFVYNGKFLEENYYFNPW